MEYRRLGNSGLAVSEIAYSNWITHASQVDEAAARACVEAALEVGMNTFDTADVYAEGGAEEVLGRALKGTRREDIVLCTKVERPMGPGPNDKGLSRKHMFESCHASLRRLGTDYVDVYYAHRFDETVPLEETMLAFADLARQGKVLYVGVSEWTAEQISRGAELARELRVPLVASQPQYSMLWRVIEEEVLSASRKEGMGQVVWSPLAQGVLSGKYLPGEVAPTGSRAANPAGKGFMDAVAGRWMTDDMLTAVQDLRPIGQESGLSLPQLAVVWVLQNPDVSAAIIGASRPEQVRENAGASGVRLDAELMRRIDEVLGAWRSATRAGRAETVYADLRPARGAARVSLPVRRSNATGRRARSSREPCPRPSKDPSLAPDARPVRTRDELTEAQWERLLPLLPPQKPKTGRPAKDHRTVVSAILWIARTGAGWRGQPADAGVCWKTAASRFYRWTTSGVWQGILVKLQRDAAENGGVDWSSHFVDGNSVRAHQHAAGARGGQAGEALGRSRGGFSTKFHIRADGHDPDGVRGRRSSAGSGS